MRRTWDFEQQSTLDAAAPDVWARVITPEGINDEMRPVMTMSVPRGSENLTIDSIAIDEPVGRAWLRLFGVIPFDYDHLRIVQMEPGRRFREESTMLSMRTWVHDRTVVPVDNEVTQVIDRVEFTPRIGLVVFGPLLFRCVQAFFGHRHRRLAAHFKK